MTIQMYLKSFKLVFSGFKFSWIGQYLIIEVSGRAFPRVPGNLRICILGPGAAQIGFEELYRC